MTRAEQAIRQAAEPQAGLPLLTLERLTFRFVGAGFVLLSATLLAGCSVQRVLYGPGLALGPQDGVLGAGLGGLRAAAAGARALRLARRTAVRVLYIGSAAAAAGLRGLALRAGSRAGARRMKYLLVFVVLLVASGSGARTGKRTRERAPPPRRRAGPGRRCRRRWCAARSARCTCRRTDALAGQRPAVLQPRAPFHGRPRLMMVGLGHRPSLRLAGARRRRHRLRQRLWRGFMPRRACFVGLALLLLLLGVKMRWARGPASRRGCWAVRHLPAGHAAGGALACRHGRPRLRPAMGLEHRRRPARPSPRCSCCRSVASTTRRCSRCRC
jgi:hypothetical protein